MQMSYLTRSIEPPNQRIDLGGTMKKLMLATVVACAASSQASDLHVVEGVLEFNHGNYHVGDTSLAGMSLSELRHYEGMTVKVAGEKRVGDLEVYKLFVKTSEGYTTSYDWDVVNQELYAN